MSGEVYGVIVMVTLIFFMYFGWREPFRKNFWLSVLLIVVFSPAYMIWAAVEGAKNLNGPKSEE